MVKCSIWKNKWRLVLFSLLLVLPFSWIHGTSEALICGPLEHSNTSNTKQTLSRSPCDILLLCLVIQDSPGASHTSTWRFNLSAVDEHLKIKEALISNSAKARTVGTYLKWMVGQKGKVELAKMTKQAADDSVTMALVREDAEQADSEATLAR